MKLYLISQNLNNHYDSYDSAVVCAPDRKTARNMSPRNGKPITKKEWERHLNGTWGSSPEDISVKYLGEARPSLKQGLICASFNAG